MPSPSVPCSGIVLRSAPSAAVPPRGSLFARWAGSAVVVAALVVTSVACPFAMDEAHAQSALPQAMSTHARGAPASAQPGDHIGQSQQKTVCTITVNSPDEKEAFRQKLPADKYRFVELVESGRPDWLASACRKGVQCDVLVISGHFAGSNFFSEELDTKEFLPVDEMERVSCSESCPGLFSKLKEVYLFGCNTLNAEAGDPSATPMAAPVASPMAVSDVLRDTRSRVNRSTERFAGEESSRERMRRIFTHVPVIYGFSSKAPIGENAAGMLNRYLRNGGTREFGSGRVSGNLLSSFRGTSLTSTTGLRDTDREAGYREQVCRFFDERVTPSKKLDFVHQILGRNNNDVRRFLDPIEKFTTSLPPAQRSEATFAKSLDEISRDDASRTRYLALMRAERPAVRARMIRLASTFGWVTSEGERNETVAMIRDVLAKPRLDSADAEFVCALNDDHDLDEETGRFALTPAQADDAGHRAALACLGDRDSHAWMPRALTSPKADDAKIGQVYYRHRPLDNATDLRAVSAAVAAMDESEAKLLALDTLARHYIADAQSLDELVRLYSRSESVAIQRAVAGILIRSDYRAVAKADLARMLADRRVRSVEGEDVIDALIRRLSS